MKHLSGFLSWDWIFDAQVPAFPAVYAGYIAMIGRNYNGAYDDGAFKVFAAQSLLYGEQMGWLSPQRYLSMNPALRAYYRALVHTRFRYNPFFVGGRPLRPPVTECSLPDIGGQGGKGAIAGAAVLSAVWEQDQTGGRLLLVTNLSEQPANISLRSEFVTKLPAGLRDATYENGALLLTLAPESVTAVIL